MEWHGASGSGHVDGSETQWTIMREYQMAGQTDPLRALQPMDLRKVHQRAMDCDISLQWPSEGRAG